MMYLQATVSVFPGRVDELTAAPDERLAGRDIHGDLETVSQFLKHWL